jgi:hypothetical protein
VWLLLAEGANAAAVLDTMAAVRSFIVDYFGFGLCSLVKDDQDRNASICTPRKKPICSHCKSRLFEKMQISPSC